ncbi:sporulation protein YabP [Paludicola sp. MB14-C6]|uniref:sporulation protein YabP n=1 Tax=Paludihabitans sp. MB14-C6 TaxID=3070656 RepID=UPI0027DB7501|nr:sporulation protein YabP [Paludicola sp. MB14-C6]WMJ23662.1 sporulation protein YabP [Paludicola sp. MB14-C6]
MLDEKNAIKLPHNLILEDRKTLSISGVEDIDSFDENMVVLFTEQGELTIRGKNLHINKLNVETGELTMDGNIVAIVYSEQQQKKQGGVFSKMLK